MSMLIMPSRFGGTGTGWNLSNLASPPSGWYDDTSAISTIGGSFQWNDISGNAYHVTQTTSANQPTAVTGDQNGLRVVQFNGTTDYLLLPSASYNVYKNVSSAWVVCAHISSINDSSNTNRNLFGMARNQDGLARVYLQSGSAATSGKNALTCGGRRLDSQASASSVISATQRSLAWHIALACIDYSARTIKLYVDGSLDASASTQFDASGSTSNTSSHSATIGVDPNGTGPFGGKIGTLAFGVGLPSSTEIDKIFGCLHWHWGLQSLLPSGHPYKSAPP